MAQGRGRRSIEEAIIFVAARSRGRALEHARVLAFREQSGRTSRSAARYVRTVTVEPDVSLVVGR